MQPSPIQWTDFTNNHIRARVRGSTATKGGYASGVGHYCVKVSPGCRGCYASELQPRFGLPVFQDQRGDNAPEVFVDVEKMLAALRRKKPTRIFWCDMTDLFGEWISNETIAATFGVFAATPQHTHQILTKRATRLPAWFDWVRYHYGNDRMTPAEGCRWEAMQIIPHRREDGSALPGPTRALFGSDTRWPLPNVHLGVSVEDQAAADARIPLLLEAPAAVRWVSAEPLLEAVDLARYLKPTLVANDGERMQHPEPRVPTTGGSWEWGLDWIVCGGESGDRARPFEVGWARSIRDQCHDAGLPYFMKQLGARPVDSRNPPAYHGGPLTLKDGHGGDPSEWPEDLRVREWPTERLIRGETSGKGTEHHEE